MHELTSRRHRRYLERYWMVPTCVSYKVTCVQYNARASFRAYQYMMYVHRLYDYFIFNIPLQQYEKYDYGRHFSRYGRSHKIIMSSYQLHMRCSNNSVRSHATQVVPAAASYVAAIVAKSAWCAGILIIILSIPF